MAVPVLNKEPFPPDVVKDIPKVEFLERITNPSPSGNTPPAKATMKKQVKAVSNTGDLNIIYIKT